MATDVAEKSADAAATKSSKKWLAILGLIIIIMGTEAGVLYVLLAPSETSDPAEEDVDDGSDSAADHVEVKLGSYNVTNSKAVPGSIHISFGLVGVVAQESQIEFEEAVNERFEARVRQAVVQVVRDAELIDLNDSNLNSLKSQIRERVNKALHKSYLIEAVISDFKTMEQ